VAVFKAEDSPSPRHETSIVNKLPGSRQTTVWLANGFVVIMFLSEAAMLGYKITSTYPQMGVS